LLAVSWILTAGGYFSRVTAGAADMGVMDHPVVDDKMKQQVQEALHSDAFFYDEHVTVTIKDGVATLRGIVFDDWDLRQAMRIARKIPGVRRVVNDLELSQGGD